MVIGATDHIAFLVCELAFDHFRARAATLVHDGRREAAEAMASLLPLKPQNLERLVYGLGAHGRVGRIPQPWKQQPIAPRVLAQFCQQRQHLARQRDDVVSACFFGNQCPFHSAGRNPPQRVIGVKLGPSRPAQFVGAREGVHHDLHGDARLGPAVIVPDSGDQLTKACLIDMREVLYWRARIEEAL
ncbi:hypothetical protein D3C85_1285300 [compost metagenome]